MNLMQLVTGSFILNVLLALGLIALIWPRRALPGAKAFMFTSMAVALWSFSAAMEYNSTTLANNRLWSIISYPGVVSVPVLLFTFVMQYTGHGRWLTRRNQILLWVIPLITLVLVVTNEWHHWHWSALTPDPLLGEKVIYYGHGPWFYVMLVYLYSLTLIAVVQLFQILLSHNDIYRRQALGILLAILLPVINNLLYVLNLSPLPGVDMAPITFSIANLLIGLNIYFFQLFNITPVARGVILERMLEGVIAFDQRGYIIDVNPAARAFLHMEGKAQIGQNGIEVLPNFKNFLNGPDSWIEIFIDDPPTWFELNLSSLVTLQGETIGRLLLIHDITPRKHVEMELRNKSLELEQLAISDGLTGLYNRRYQESRLVIEFERCERLNGEMAIGMCDLDLLKQINDRFGHAGGDEVLRVVANEMRACMRSSDLIARVGGDEFVILFPQTSLEDARCAMERLRQRLKQVDLACIQHQPITLSAGLTAWFAGDTSDNAMQRADRLLYSAKNQGRDRIVCSITQAETDN